MLFISQDDWAKKMSLTPRQVGDLLRAGKVAGAVKVGKYWRLPDVVADEQAHKVEPVAVVPADEPVVDEPIVDDPVVEEETHDVDVVDNRTPAEKARDEAVLKAETAKALREAAADNLATKQIEIEMSDFDQREQVIKDAEDVLAKRTASLESREAVTINKEDAVAVKEASIESAAEKIIQDAKDKATGIIGNATLQAGSLVTAAKEEAAKVRKELKIRSEEVGKVQADLAVEQDKLTNSRAVVERCLSRIDRDTKELTLYPSKDWPARLKTLVDFVTSSLQDGS